MEKSRRHLLPFVQLTKPDYITDRFHVELCKIVEEFHRRVQRKESPRVIIVCHPQSGKSTIVSRHYPAWGMGQNPEYCWIGSSYNQDWAGGLCSDVQRIMDTDEYRETFPHTLIPPKGSRLGKRVGDYFELVGQPGRYKAAGRGASPAGRPAHVLIIDDFLKGADEALSETIREAAWQAYVQDLRPRVQRGGGILMMFTRWHLDDPIGRALENAQQGGEQWDVHVFPALALEDAETVARPDGTIEVRGDWRKKGDALAPSRFNEKDLAAIKSVLPTAAWCALYEGSPVALTGNIFESDKWKYYGGPNGQPAFPDIRQFDGIVASWDASFKDTTGADYVSGQVWGVRGAEFWLFVNGYILEKMSYVRFREAIRQQAYEHKLISFRFIEETANGAAVISELQTELGGIIPVTPEGGKIARAWAASSDVAAGNCFLPDPSIAPYIGGFVKRCTRFPGDIGKPGTDDDIDAFTQMVNQMRFHTHPLIEIWKEKAAKNRAAETKQANGETAPPEGETAETELAKAQKLAAVERGIFGAEKFGSVQKLTQSAMSKPSTNPKTEACPDCGNVNLSKYGEITKCNKCGWKRQA